MFVVEAEEDKKYGYLHKALYEFMGQTSEYLSNDSQTRLFQNGFLKIQAMSFRCQKQKKEMLVVVVL